MADWYLKNVTIHQYTDGSMELIVPRTLKNKYVPYRIPLTKSQQKQINSIRYLNWSDTNGD